MTDQDAERLEKNEATDRDDDDPPVLPEFSVSLWRKYGEERKLATVQRLGS